MKPKISFVNVSFCLLLCLLFFLVTTLIDVYVYSRIELNTEEKLRWLANEIGVSETIIKPPSEINILPQKELEDIRINKYPEDHQATKDYLEILKKLGLRIGGFYTPLDQSLYLSKEYADDEAFVHELTHHILHLAIGNINLETIAEPEFIDNGEELAKEIARRYIKQKRWSLNILFALGNS